MKITRTMKERLVPFKNQRFECQMCGECCRLRYVPLTMEDIKRLSQVKDPRDFVVIFGEKKLVLDRREWDSGCVFLYDRECTVQEKKPIVCRLYPVCVSDKPLTEGSEPVKAQDGEDMYVYVDASCKGVGKGAPLDLEEIKKIGFVLRAEAFATDLEALIGWYTDENEDIK